MNENAPKKKGGLMGVCVKRRDVFIVPLDVLKEDPGYNCRLIYDGIEDFAQYVLTNGVKRIPPMTVRKDPKTPGSWFIIQGHRRIRAYRRAVELGAEIKGVLVMSDDESTDEERTIDLVTSNEGQPLSKLEKGIVFLRLLNNNWDQADIAQRTGMSPAYVSQAIALARAPMKIRELMVKGAVSDSTVLDALIGSKDNETGILDEQKAYEIVTQSIEESNNNGEGRRGVSRRVKAAVGKVSASGRIKLLNEMIEEQSLVLKDSPKYQAVKDVYAFLNGEKTVDELITALSK